MKELIEKIVHSLLEYVEAIVSIEQKTETGPFIKKELLYRGLSSSAYELKPAVDRSPAGPWMNTLQSLEKELVESACRKFPLLFDAKDYPALLLAKLQHFGIPTRMMDVTANALVALYFACQKSRDSKRANDDGKVYVFEESLCSPFNPYVNAIADTYRLTRNAFIGVDSYFYKVKLQEYYKPADYDANDQKTELEHFIKTIEAPYFVDAGDFCDRQKNQQGKFIIFPNKVTRIAKDAGKIWEDDLPEEETEPTMCDNLVEIDEETIAAQITISFDCKEEILEQLKRFGVSKEYLFADSVDAVCGEITNEISKRFSK